MNTIGIAVGWLWGGNNQLAKYEIWRLSISRLLVEWGQIPCPTFLALWITSQDHHNSQHEISNYKNESTRLLLRNLKDAVDYRLNRDPVLFRAFQFCQTLPRDQQPLAHSFIFRKLGDQQILPGREIDPSLFRKIPTWMPDEAPIPDPESSTECQWIQETIAGLEKGTGFFHQSDLILLTLGLAHLSPSEQKVASEVLEAIQWFDTNRRHSPTLSSTGGSTTSSISGLGDDFPTGGIDSIAHKGPWENLVPSELVYLEDRWPSLFEIRWLNQELLFHGRDESVHRRPVMVWWIRVNPQVGDWLFQHKGSPFRLAAMALGWAFSVAIRLRKAFGEWDFQIHLETPPVLERPHEKMGSGKTFLAFLDVFGRRLGFNPGKPDPKQAEVNTIHHKLIFMELGGFSPDTVADHHMVLFAPPESTRPENCLIWDQPQTARDWLELDQLVMNRLPGALLQGKG